jgi:outer membrane protein
VPQAGACEQNPCSLAELIDLVTTTHPLIQAARAGTSVFEAKLKQVRLAHAPELDLTTWLSATPEKTGNANVGKSNYDRWGPYVRIGVTGVLPIYSFGKLRWLKEMASQGISVGKAQEQIARSELEAMVVKAWYGFVFTSQLDSTLEEGGKHLRRARKYIEKLRDSDDDDYDDVVMLRLKLFESEFESQKMEASRAKRLALSALKTLSGLQAEELSPPPALETVPVESHPLETYVEKAYGSRGELRAIEAGLRARGAEVTYAKRKFLPDIFLGASYTYSRAWAIEVQPNSEGYDPYNFSALGAALGLSWDFNFSKLVGTLAEAKAEVRKLRAQRLALRQQVALEVEEAFLELNDLKRQLELDRDGLKAARGWLLAKLDLYEAGVGTFDDVGDALTVFFKRRIAFDKTTYEHNLAVAALARACGTTFEEMLPSPQEAPLPSP